MLYTASYFEPQFHHGKLIAISQTIPKGFRVDSRLDFLAPSKPLLADWKAESVTQEQYIERYREQLKKSWGKVQKWLSSLNSKADLTLMCWEPKGQFCHRNLVALLVKRHRPDCFGGCDVIRIEMDRCARCGNQLIPGLDADYCPSCKSLFYHRSPA